MAEWIRSSSGREEAIAMVELLGWDVGMGWLAITTLIAAALVIGIVAQVIGETATGWEWAPVGLGALIGGWIGSEALAGASTWGPVFEGMYLLPALIGALVLGAVVDLVVRYATGGHYLPAPRPI
jgi:uncharacterized membrane protein YeaQ/YmgE (transglycosylase-associated protein family)